MNNATDHHYMYNGVISCCINYIKYLIFRFFCHRLTKLSLVTYNSLIYSNVLVVKACE